MSDSAPKSPAAPCPRCRSTTTAVLAESPVSGVWTMFSCQTCFYTWRSTEPDDNTDPNKYPNVFRLDPNRMADLPVVPPTA